MNVLRSLVFATAILVTGVAQAQDCSGSFPTCNGTCPEGFVCGQPRGLPSDCSCLAGAPLALRQLAIKSNFAKPLKDTVTLKALVPVPDDFDVYGRLVTVDVGGLTRTFVLDEKGMAKSDGTVVKLSVKEKKGVVAAQDAKLIFKGAQGNFASNFFDEGLVDITVKESAVSVRVDVTVNGSLHSVAQPLRYTAKQGKSGKAKNPK